MKPVHEWASVEPRDSDGRERPSTGDPGPPDDEHAPPEVGTSPDADRLLEEAGYGYGV